MTTPRESRESLKRARAFLYALLDPKATPRVPKGVRHEACRVLRHYPADFQVDEIYERAGEDCEW